MKTGYGQIVKVQNAVSGLDIQRHPGTVARFTLDTGYTWSGMTDSANLGDVVRVEPYLMGTVRVVNLGAKIL